MPTFEHNYLINLHYAYWSRFFGILGAVIEVAKRGRLRVCEKTKVGGVRLRICAGERWGPVLNDGERHGLLLTVGARRVHNGQQLIRRGHFVFT